MEGSRISLQLPQAASTPFKKVSFGTFMGNIYSLHNFQTMYNSSVKWLPHIITVQNSFYYVFYAFGVWLDVWFGDL